MVSVFPIYSLFCAATRSLHDSRLYKVINRLYFSPLISLLARSTSLKFLLPWTPLRRTRLRRLVRVIFTITRIINILFLLIPFAFALTVISNWSMPYRSYSFVLARSTSSKFLFLWTPLRRTRLHRLLSLSVPQVARASVSPVLRSNTFNFRRWKRSSFFWKIKSSEENENLFVFWFRATSQL